MYHLCRFWILACQLYDLKNGKLALNSISDSKLVLNPSKLQEQYSITPTFPTKQLKRIRLTNTNDMTDEETFVYKKRPDASTYYLNKQNS